MKLSFLPNITIRAAAFALVGLLAAGTLSEESAAQQQRTPPSAVGLWEQVDDDGRVGGWFHIYERDGTYEGKIVKAFPRPGEKPNALCTKCPGDQKNQPVLGLTLIKGMQRKGRNFENGSILDPRDGSVYQARMELSPDGQKLMMRGFLGIDLFGQSQIWRRLPDSAMAEVMNGAHAPGATPGATAPGATGTTPGGAPGPAPAPRGTAVPQSQPSAKR